MPLRILLLTKRLSAKTNLLLTSVVFDDYGSTIIHQNSKTMKENILKQQLADNCKEKFQRLTELLRNYELAHLGWKVQVQREIDLRNKVLAENEFHFGEDARCGGEFNIGDRITDEVWDFLMEEDEWKVYREKVEAELHAAGLTDEKGYYLIPWTTHVCDTRRALTNFILDELLPKELSVKMESCRINVVQGNKLIEIVKKLAA